MKNLTMILFVTFFCQVAYGQYVAPWTSAKKNTKKAAAGTTAKVSLDRQIEDKVKQAISVNLADPRKIQANGQEYRLRKGKNMSVADSKLRTFTNNKGDTIQAYRVGKFKEGDLTNDVDDEFEDFTVNVRAATCHPKAKITAEECLKRGEYIEACEIRNADGSCKYIVRKIVEGKDEVQHGVVVKKTIPAGANAAQIKKNTYQSVRNTDLPYVFGPTLQKKYGGTFGAETYDD